MNTTSMSNVMRVTVVVRTQMR